VGWLIFWNFTSKESVLSTSPNDFYTMKSPRVGDFGDKLIKNIYLGVHFRAAKFLMPMLSLILKTSFFFFLVIYMYVKNFLG
jgi:hypothetical protein